MPDSLANEDEDTRERNHEFGVISDLDEKPTNLFTPTKELTGDNDDKSVTSDEEHAQPCDIVRLTQSTEDDILPQDEPPGLLADTPGSSLEVSKVETDAQQAGWTLRAKVAILVCLASCCCNVVFLELLVRKDPGIGNLVTFSQFLIIGVEGFIFTTKFGTVTPKVPFSSWLVLVIMYFLVSVTNNYALSYHIPMPLHMIFRAGSLMANMLMGMVILGKRYKTVKYVSVIMITLGIATCTVMSATSRVSLKTGKAVFEDPANVSDSEANCADEKKLSEALEQEAESVRLKQMMIGISFLTFALFLSARMGIYQEVIFSKFGKHAKEALFYTHALPLPGFLLLAPDILHHWQICVASELVPLPLFGTEIPIMVLHLIGNVIPQYLCISAVFVLTTECPSLTASLVLTFRKFLSLLFSIWYFQNPFTLAHWVGTCLVFCGIVLFSDIPGYITERRQIAKKKMV